MKNTVAETLLQKKASTVVVVRVPNDVYTETIAKRGRLITEAANHGDTSNISINDIMIMALRTFNKDGNVQ